MAKYRHKTFEMFDFPDEAKCALTSKPIRHAADFDDPQSWSFQHLIAQRSENVIHVKFKKWESLPAEFSGQLRKDFLHLAGSLINDSRVLLDFECLSEFGCKEIDELKRLNTKLQSKGSRMVLCNLEPSVRDSFFPSRNEGQSL